jgi:glycosyltransferase involved in cell wall biosynthesis
VERIIKEHNLSDQVRVTGWVTNQEVRNQLLAARAMVLPSFAEGLPVVIMEALALGRPVLSTFVAGIPELVEPANTGYLVPAGSVEHLVAGIKSVLAEPIEKLREMGRQGAVRVAKQHDARKEAVILSDLFRALAVGKQEKIELGRNEAGSRVAGKLG